MRVVILGAGHAGVTLAYFLKKAGVEITVIEKDFVGSGETGYSTGVFPMEQEIFDFYREFEDYTLHYFKPVVYDHVNGDEKGRSIYVDGYNYAYYTSIVLEKEGVKFEVMNPFHGIEFDDEKITGIKTDRGVFDGDIFIVAAGGSTPFIVQEFENLEGIKFKWVRSLLLKPVKRFTRQVIYDDEFVIKPEGEERLILRENQGIKVELQNDVVNKTRGVDKDFYTVVYKYLEEKHPELMDVSVERGWASLCMESEKPMRKSKRFKNLYIFAGFGCMGFSVIPKMAKKLVKEVLQND